MLCFPPRVTHEAQPLDCGVFSTLKSHSRTFCYQFIQSNPCKTATKFNFNELFAEAWLQAVRPANIIAGLKACGVYPFDRSAITVHSKPDDKQDCQKENSNVVLSDGEQCNDASRSDTDKEQSDSELNTAIPRSFSIEQGELFQKRFNEGYNLYIRRIHM